MKNVTLTVGIPASGKTTWARQFARDNKNVVITSRDDIRNTHGWKSGFDENRVTRIQRSQIEAALLEGMDVIVADTNINPEFRRQLVKFCHEHGADVELMVFPISLDEAVLRDSKRQSHKVGPDVVTRFYNDLKNQDLGPAILPAPKFEPYEHKPERTWADAVVIDIDGTIAHNAHRGPYDESKVGTDEPISDVIAVTSALGEFFDLVFVSGRTDSCRAETEKWLQEQYLFDSDTPEYHLFMRKTGDKRPDYVVKAEIYDQEVIPVWNITMVFDDRDQVVRHVRARGITVAQVRPGRF